MSDLGTLDPVIHDFRDCGGTKRLSVEIFGGPRAQEAWTYSHDAMDCTATRFYLLGWHTDKCPAKRSREIIAHERQIRQRLEYLRCELRAERISYGELLELQELAPHIYSDDVELLEAAGVPEFAE